jgi:hypothetical protein
MRGQNVRRQNRRQRILSRLYERHVRRINPTNNKDTLRRIENLPQQISDDLLVNQFFNGSPLH